MYHISNSKRVKNTFFFPSENTDKQGIILPHLLLAREENTSQNDLYQPSQESALQTDKFDLRDLIEWKIGDPLPLLERNQLKRENISSQQRYTYDVKSQDSQKNVSPSTKEPVENDFKEQQQEKIKQRFSESQIIEPMINQPNLGQNQVFNEKSVRTQRSIRERKQLSAVKPDRSLEKVISKNLGNRNQRGKKSDKNSQTSLPHVCERASNSSEQCMICLKYLSPLFSLGNFASASFLRAPQEVFYVDYVQTYGKKILLPKREKDGRCKRFLQLRTVTEIQEFVKYILDRSKPFLGIEDQLAENLENIPKIIQQYSEKVFPSEFSKFSVLGDFESSNIACCSVDKSNEQLLLLLRSDTNTKGCIHWFQFTIVAKEPCKIQIQILNNQRKGQFYSDGMMIAILDSTDSQGEQSCQNVLSWKRGGESIFYYKSNVDHAFYRESEIPAKQISNTVQNGYQTLEFSYSFTHPKQRVMFAYSYSYTFTDLCHFLENAQKNLEKQQFSTTGKEQVDQNSSLAGHNKNYKQNSVISQEKTIKVLSEDILFTKKVLGVSRLGLPIYLLKITANGRSGPFKKRKRKVIFIIARQHPGETPSSFVCQGLIEFLLSSSPSARILRSAYIFKIIPMMNPDGVVLGNTRCNLSGFDLNRKWSNPDESLTPEVFLAKSEMKRTQLKREIVMFCDLHGHSQLMGFFMYSCNQASDGFSWTKARLLPHILAKRSKAFNLSQCRFKVTEDRVNTARVTAWKELGIQQSFTIETSFFGYQSLDEENNKKCNPFSVEDLLGIGKTLGNSFLEHLVILDQLYYEIKESKGILTVTQGSLVTQKSKVDLEKKESLKKNYNLNCKLISNKRSPSPSPNNQKERKIPLKKTRSENKQSQALHEVIFKEACPEIEKSWRDYFNIKDLEANFNLIAQGSDPNDFESIDGGSDSEPEGDLYHSAEWPFPKELNPQIETKHQPNTQSQSQQQNINEIPSQPQTPQQKNYQEKEQSYQNKPRSKSQAISINFLQKRQSPIQQQAQRNRYPISQVAQTFGDNATPTRVYLFRSTSKSVDPMEFLRYHYDKKKQQKKQESQFSKVEFQRTYLNPRIIKENSVLEEKERSANSQINPRLRLDELCQLSQKSIQRRDYSSNLDNSDISQIRPACSAQTNSPRKQPEIEISSTNFFNKLMNINSSSTKRCRNILSTSINRSNITRAHSQEGGASSVANSPNLIIPYIDPQILTGRNEFSNTVFPFEVVNDLMNIQSNSSSSPISRERLPSKILKYFPNHKERIVSSENMKNLAPLASNKDILQALQLREDFQIHSPALFSRRKLSYYPSSTSDSKIKDKFS